MNGVMSRLHLWKNCFQLALFDKWFQVFCVECYSHS